MHESKEFQKCCQGKINVELDFYMKLSAEFRCIFGWKKQTTSDIKSWLELKENLSTTVKELKNAYMAFYT